MISKIAFLSFNIVCFCILNSNQASVRSLIKDLRQKPSTASLTLTEWPSYNLFEPNGPGTYAFGYEIEDDKTQNIQFRDEEKLQNGTVRGSYGTVRPNGLVSLTQYIADQKGYRADTQTFGNTNANPILLTSTQSPIAVPASPHDIDYLDITISPDIGQQIIDKATEINLKPNTSSDTTSINQFNSGMNSQNSKPQFSIDRDDAVYEVYEDENDVEQNDTFTDENFNLNLKPEYSTINAAINQQYPIKFITKDNQTFGIQLVNNFIPHNFQIIPFSLPKQSIKKKKMPASEANRPEVAHDEIFDETDQQVNDKFFDPIFDGKLLRRTKYNNKRNLLKRKSISNRRNNYNYNNYRFEHNNLLRKYGLI